MLITLRYLWQRYWVDTPYPELVKTVPHVAFEVDELEVALEGYKSLVSVYRVPLLCFQADGPARPATPRDGFGPYLGGSCSGGRLDSLAAEL